MELEVNICEVLKRYMVSILSVLAFIIEKHRDTYTNSYIYTHTYAALQVKDKFIIYMTDKIMIRASIYGVSCTWTLYENTMYCHLHFTNEETEAQ